MMPDNVVVLFEKREGRALVREMCEKHGLSFSDFEELVEVEIKQHGRKRRHGLYEDFDDILNRIADGDFA